VVIADYMMWYDASTFDGSSTWDVPAAGPYNSGDYGVIQRQVAEAQQACLDGFAAHWYGPDDPTTTNNFNKLLQASAGTNLRHTIVIQANIVGNASEDGIAAAIRYALDNWAYGPNYLRLGGRPVLVFTDMDRPWGSDAAAADGWARIRAAVDPNHNSIWMAEGLYPTFNRCSTVCTSTASTTATIPILAQAAALGGRPARRGKPDRQQPVLRRHHRRRLRRHALGEPVRRSAQQRPALRRDRQGGAYYADTFAVTSQTGGDFLFVKSFNEWIEGTEIEPGASYGDAYLNQTCGFANEYRSR